MEEKRALWVASFSAGDVPAYVCPRCGQGTLRLDKETIHEARTADSRAFFEAEDFYDPVLDEGRFILMLVCSRGTCGEPVTVSGTTSNSTHYGPEGEVDFETMYHPASMIPGPHLASIPEGTPELVAKALKQGFTLFWTDLGASANKLRVAAERLLDSRKVKKTTINKQRKRVTLSLASRIDIYAKQNAAHKPFLDALRWVGNQASHEGEIDREDLLTGYELMQEGLRDLYGAQYRKELAKRGRDIVARKGRARKPPRKKA